MISTALLNRSFQDLLTYGVGSWSIIFHVNIAYAVYAVSESEQFGGVVKDFVICYFHYCVFIITNLLDIHIIAEQVILGLVAL